MNEPPDKKPRKSRPDKTLAGLLRPYFTYSVVKVSLNRLVKQPIYKDREKNLKMMEVNEAYTTKMCHQCQNETKVVRHWKEVEKLDGSKKEVLAQIYGLRRCSNNECRITWDRDMNASKNILKVLDCKLKGLERPGYLKKIGCGNLVVSPARLDSSS